MTYPESHKPYWTHWFSLNLYLIFPWATHQVSLVSSINTTVVQDRKKVNHLRNRIRTSIGKDQNRTQIGK
jgi:hypothetical protein